ncbi:nuclease-related domain-containing protein [Marinobacter sp. R17]|uniref:nuclease-related domain-containing protein n=1 Tax=Marinobacter sp. R17 TaxID=2484250 RepID=UPI001CC1EE8E|nr:nuclease-related domain-containing protein [Marinobacter sp. R17]
MDFAPVLQPLIHALWYLIPLAILGGIIKSPQFKGWVGESLVNLSARLFLDKNTYHLIRNVTLPTEDGTTQIDHIIVSPYGVFVVETKNMKGWIFGSAKQRYWTQKIYKHSQKFQNPLHQNYKHVKTIQALLGLGDAQVHSVVVFVGDATFKTKMPANVTRGGGYLRFIKSYPDWILTAEQVKSVLETIASGRLASSLKTYREHLRHVQRLVTQKNGTTDFGGVTPEDRLVQRKRPSRSRWIIKPIQASQPSEATYSELPKVISSACQAGVAAERAFSRQYVEVEGLGKWRSERRLVECINHRVRAETQSRAGYFGLKSVQRRYQLDVF